LIKGVENYDEKRFLKNRKHACKHNFRKIIFLNRSCVWEYNFSSMQKKQKKKSKVVFLSTTSIKTKKILMMKLCFEVYFFTTESFP